MSTSRLKPFPWLRRVAAAVALLVGAPLAHADTNATTDDKSVTKTTSWYTYTNVSAASLGNLLSANSARLTDIEIYSGTTPTFTATMVRNSGSYGVPGWWWYYGLTSAQVSSQLTANNARLIDIEPYSTPAGIRFAVIMVSNTGTAARGWNWLVGVSSSQINTFINNASTGSAPQRIVDLKSYTENGTKKYVMVSINNTGADAKSWQYWFNQSVASVGSRVNSFGGRVTVLERQSDGTYNFVQVKNSGTDNAYWRYHFGLTSVTQANQVATQFGSRVLDLETYVSNSKRYYDAVMIDNATTEGRRMRTAFGTGLVLPNGLPNGQWGAYLKPLGGSALVSLNADRRFEPASAIKAVHNAAIMDRIAAGDPDLDDALTRYQYPSDTAPYDSDGNGTNDTYKGLTGDACPYPANEIAANAVTSTFNSQKDAMMTNSDNRSTRALTLYFGSGANTTEKGIDGIAKLEDYAFDTLGMTDTFMNQPRIGCGWADSQRNQTTLVDLGKLYEIVQNGTLVGTTTHRTEFFQPMNGGAFGTTGLEGMIRAVVTAEGQSLGKSQSQVQAFIDRMEWRYKPGGYGISCDNPFVPCDGGYISILTQAGVLTLPKKSGDFYLNTRYVFGSYVADVNACDPGASSGEFGYCGTCPDCDTSSTVESVINNARKELFRSVIRQNLATF